MKAKSSTGRENGKTGYEPEEASRGPILRGVRCQSEEFGLYLETKWSATGNDMYHTALLMMV